MSENIFVTNIFEYSYIRIYSSHSEPKRTKPCKCLVWSVSYATLFPWFSLFRGLTNGQSPLLRLCPVIILIIRILFPLLKPPSSVMADYCSSTIDCSSCLVGKLVPLFMMRSSGIVSWSTLSVISDAFTFTRLRDGWRHQNR